VHVAEAFAVELADLALQIGGLLADDMRTELPVGTRFVAFAADLLAGIEDDGDGECMIFPREPHQMRAVLLAHIGGVDNHQLPPLQADFRYGVDQRERVRGGVEAVLIVLDETTAGVRRDHLGRFEMPPGEGRFARAGCAD